MANAFFCRHVWYLFLALERTLALIHVLFLYAVIAYKMTVLPVRLFCSVGCLSSCTEVPSRV